jgi:SAM-dependent methyltransferase
MEINEDFLARGKYQDIGRWYVSRFVARIAQDLPAGASVLDAGAGECVYKRLFSHCLYKAIDLAVGEDKWNYANLDYIGPLHDMPIGSAQFDAVLCTQVLEHLEWPRESVKEMYRVLKPGGRLYLTVPMAQNEHQVPHDFFRYTSYGLASICRNAGFSSVEIEPFGGLWVRWAYELPRGLSIFPSDGLRSGSPSAAGIALLPLKVPMWLGVRLLQMLFVWLDRFDRKKNDPWGWACVATK